jgi:hypothetical protein
MNEWEPTNAPLLVIETECGLLAIDPFEETYIEAGRVVHLWTGRLDIQLLQSNDNRGSINFVSLDWLIKIHPTQTWLKTVSTGIKNRIRVDGFEADDE